MKNIFILIIILLFVPFAYGKDMRLKSVIGINNPDDPQDGNVVPATIDFYYDNEGRLIKIQYPEMYTGISYENINDGYLFIEIVIPDAGYSTGYKAFLDSDGKVTVAEKASEGFGANTFAMQYTDGHLSSFIETGDQVTNFTNLTYDSGNIVKTESFSDINPDDIEWRQYSYSGVANTHGINMLESFFEVELEGMEILAQAGFLGEPPAEFFSSMQYSYGEMINMSYEFNEEGYLIKFYLTDEPAMGFNVVWEEAPEVGVDLIKDQEYDLSGIYLLDGTPVTEMQIPGLYIIRGKDGSCRKILKND